jgi:RimJ/RimL family protein N-acetyltransferase
MLETDRLVLRKWRKADRSQAATILGDPDVMEFSDRGTLNSEQLFDWFKKALAVRTGDILSGPLAIVQKFTGEVVGYVGLSNDPERNERDDVEIGFRLSRHVWGNGYATEAVAGLLRRTGDIPSNSRIVAIVDPHNKRSIRVLEKLGLSQVGEMMFDGYDYPDALYALKLRVP